VKIPRALVVGSALAALAAWSPLASAMTDSELSGRLAARFAHDRTGVCVVAAVIEGRQVARAAVCASPRPDRAPRFDTAFEIGSVGKTMTAFLVADLIEQGKWSLDDPIAKHLPPSTQVPRQGKRQILVRDLVTHSSSLPSQPPRFEPADDSNPYARLTEGELLASLRDVRLARPIGTKLEYSNFGFMLLSVALARAYGTDFETALRSRLFEPLGMKDAFVAQAPVGVVIARGHTEDGEVTPYWTMATNLAGAGLVHAHLDDMVKYAQAQAGAVATPLAARMKQTHRELFHGVGMAWGRDAIKGKVVVTHEGSTGGFLSLVALLPDEQRAVVILADTNLDDLGGLVETGLPLLGLGLPMPTPRVTMPIPAALRQAIQGTYDLESKRARIWDEGGRLMVKVAKDSAIELAYDSHGDLYAAADGLLVTPVLLDGPINRFAWRQDGSVREGVRLGARGAPLAINPAWRDWAGEYRLPAFRLRIFESAGQLRVQKVGQASVIAEVTGRDRLEIPAFGVAVELERAAKGKVVGLTLTQDGQRLRGSKRESPRARGY
jgi:CubicO group peptidase (beta-lactamase class C family)